MLLGQAIRPSTLHIQTEFQHHVEHKPPALDLGYFISESTVKIIRGTATHSITKQVVLRRARKTAKSGS